MSQIKYQRPTWAEINLESLAFNFRSVKSFVGEKINYLAVVKADAYGHSAGDCARRLEREGVDWFGVAIPEEGLELRKIGITKPILCLGSFWKGQENLLIEAALTPVVYRTEQLDLLNRACAVRRVVADVHIKIDTGMGRIGVRVDEFSNFVQQFSNYRNLKVQGIMTHFAAADNLNENDFTAQQIERFEECVKIAARCGINPFYLDLANSPGAIVHPQARGNLVRLGGVLYGLGDDVLPKNVSAPELKPVMSVKTEITHLKKVLAGETLGYSRTFETKRDSLIATIPIGYEDGLPRILSNRGRVLVNGIFAPIVGRVSMDWTIVDVTDAPDTKIGDQVVVIGEQNNLHLRASELAELSETISYEITCGINRRVPRIYVGSQ